ncbi:MAG: FGGY family carbohydrate kinase [Bowdeniella nasicola]|nr:FGGY family carbohydrate kinase [Bowdeniella nasicola]
MAQFSVSEQDALDPLIVALDVGSSGTRCALYDAAGTPVKRRRLKAEHQFTTRADGEVSIDPDQVVAEVRDLLDAVVGKDLVGRIGGVAMDTFAASIVGVDEKDDAVTTCFTYADSRGAEHVSELREVLDIERVHERTGAFIHTSYVPARLRWFRATQGVDPRRIDRWMSLGEYVYLKLLGETATGTATAAWTGMLDRLSGEWDESMVAAAGIRVSQLSEIRDPDQPIMHDGPDNDRWPALKGVAWYPVIADGLASNIGPVPPGVSGCVLGASTSGAMRVFLPKHPTQVPAGLWCYRVDRHRSLLGGAINDAGRIPAWLSSVLQLPDQETISQWVSAEPEAATPLLLPFLTGERATGWRADARAIYTGISAAHGVREIYRGSLEGLTQAYARVARELFAVHPAIDSVIATGGMSQGLPAWLTMVADVLGKPVVPATFKRSTLRGTALLALEHAAPDVPRATPPVGEMVHPRPHVADYYREQAKEFERIYSAVIRNG